MNTADIVAELESRYSCVQGVMRAICDTGEPYVAIGMEDWSRKTMVDPASLGSAIPGTTRCTAPRRHYLTEDEACRDFLEAFGLYEKDWRDRNPEGPHPVLFWRYNPPVHWYPDERSTWEHRKLTPWGAVRCRLVLSNLPVVEVSDADYDAARTSQLERELLGGTNG